MYIDDVSTLETARGNGFADELLRWVITEAQRRHCEGVHLDSGVGTDRAAAHRLYMRNRLRISAHHFSLELDS
jgi:GNAT superfamily N-acetyltransferase